MIDNWNTTKPLVGTISSTGQFMAEHRRCRETLPAKMLGICLLFVFSLIVLQHVSWSTNISQGGFSWELNLPWPKRATNDTMLSDSQADLHSVLEIAASYAPAGLGNAVMVAEVNDGFFPLAHNLYKQLKVRFGYVCFWTKHVWHVTSQSWP
jgi:hypothetical protein